MQGPGFRSPAVEKNRVNSSPYIALLAIKRLVSENVTNASPSILSAILQCRYMDDLLLSSDSLVELKTISRESRLLFESRGFTLRKWVSNNAAKSVFSDVPPSDRTSNLKEIDLASQPMPDSKALGLKWKVEEDTLCICPDRKLTEVSTRRQMLSASRPIRSFRDTWTVAFNGKTNSSKSYCIWY